MKLQLPRERRVFAAEVGRPIGVECLNTENQQKLQPEPLVCAPVPVRLPMLRCAPVGVDGALRAVATGRLMALVGCAPQRRRGPDISAEAIRAKFLRGCWRGRIW